MCVDSVSWGECKPAIARWPYTFRVDVVSLLFWRKDDRQRCPNEIGPFTPALLVQIIRIRGRVGGRDVAYRQGVVGEVQGSSDLLY